MPHTNRIEINPRVMLAYNAGFRAKELRDVRRLAEEHGPEFLETWNDNFGA